MLVDRQVVKDDDIAGTQRRREDLVDVGLGAVVIEGAIEDRGGGQAAERQADQHGMRLPVPAGV